MISFEREMSRSFARLADRPIDLGLQGRNIAIASSALSIRRDIQIRGFGQGVLGIEQQQIDGRTTG